MERSKWRKKDLDLYKEKLDQAQHPPLVRQDCSSSKRSDPPQTSDTAAKTQWRALLERQETQLLDLVPLDESTLEEGWTRIMELFGQENAVENYARYRGKTYESHKHFVCLRTITDIGPDSASTVHEGEQCNRCEDWCVQIQAKDMNTVFKPVELTLPL